MATASPTRVAIIGAGNIAAEHALAFSRLQNVELVGVYSRTQDRAVALADKFGIPSVAESSDELFQRTQADLVVVTVSVESMESVAQAAMNHPWAILLEKPPGFDLVTYKRILDKMFRTSARVYVGLNRRFMSSTQAVLGSLGDDGNRYISILDQQDRVRAQSLGSPKEVLDRWAFANSIHLIDYFSMLARGECIDAHVESIKLGSSSTMVTASLLFASGDAGAYACVWEGPGPWAVSVNTSRARFEMRPLEKALMQPHGGHSMQVLSIEEPPGIKPGFLMQADQAVRAVKGLPSQSVTLQACERTMRLIERIYGGERPILG